MMSLERKNDGSRYGRDFVRCNDHVRRLAMKLARVMEKG